MKCQSMIAASVNKRITDHSSLGIALVRDGSVSRLGLQLQEYQPGLGPGPGARIGMK